MKKILILMGRYLPGHKDGGPLRTIINVTEALGDEYDFHIACLDRDHGDTEAYPDIVYDEWNTVGKAKVWYVKGGFTRALIKILVAQVDLVYVCGFYDDYGYKTLWLNRFNRLHGKPVVVASMGTFSEGALSQKSFKKKVFISLCKLLGLFKKITWSVTSALEREQVYKNIGKKAKCVIAEDLPRNCIPPQKERTKGELKIAFLSRICAHKNLDFAIRAIAEMKERVVLNIYGPIQESAYWENCQNLLKNVSFAWKYWGDVPSEAVQERLAENDVFIFPSKGENYGHVVFEALSVGCIPVISDRTPWTELEKKNCGFICPLNVKDFAVILNRISDMTFEEKKIVSDNAINLAKEKLEASLKETGYRTIFG